MKTQTLRTQSSVQPFARTSFTWLTYLLYATYTYIQVSPGSIVPYLHTEFHLDYTLDSLHLSSLALGAVLAGLAGSFLVKRWSRRVIIWSAAVFMLLGVLLLIFSSMVAFSLAGFFFMGLGGATAGVFIQAALGDYYGDQRTTAITEANTGSSIAAVLGPLVLSACVMLGLGWRGMLFVPFVSVALLAFFWHDVPIVDAPRSFPEANRAGSMPEAEKIHTPLPRSFWLYLLLMVLVISLEWGVLFWGSGYLMHVVGLERNVATTLMSLFFVAESLGRLVCSRFTRRFPVEFLLPMALVVGSIGFLLFWWGPDPLVNIVGLFVAGLGIANLFPLSYSAMANQVPERADVASIYGTLGGGLAILSAPLILGRVADAVGLRWGLSVVALFFVLSVATFLVVRRIPTLGGSTLPVTIEPLEVIDPLQPLEIVDPLVID